MTPILLDTNAYAALSRGDRDALAIVQMAPRIGVSVIVLGELLGGFRMGKQEQANRELLEQFLASPRVDVLQITEFTADRYADLKSQLRNIGKPIPTNDLWIAAAALEHGMTIFSYDAHFRAVPLLNVVTKGSEIKG